MRVLIVDDHPIFRAGLKEVLVKHQVKAIGEADNGQAALALARRERWDVVLLDITMPEKDGVEVLNDLRRERPKLPILVLSAHPEDQMAMRLLKAGAAGYLTKDKAPHVLLSAIEKVMRGERYISESLAERTVLHVITDAPKLLHETLSDREYQVMRMIAAGKSINEIGEALFISARTVSTYRTRLLEKLNLKNNTEILRYALDHKLI